jgi:hypothetical protein
VLGFWAFHLIGIGIFMDVGPLCWISSLLWLGLLPGAFWDFLALRWQKVRERPWATVLQNYYNRLLAWRNRRIQARVEARLPMPSFALWIPSQLIAAFFLWFVTVWNFGDTPRQVQWLSAFTRLDQQWSMFAPVPTHEDGWFAMPARWKNGVEADLYTRRPVAWTKPAEINEMFPDERWRKYLMNLWMLKYRDQWDNVGKWACRASLKHDAPGNQLQSFKVYYMFELTVPPGKPQTPAEKVFLWEHYCSPQDAPEHIKRQNGIATANTRADKSL